MTQIVGHEDATTLLRFQITNHTFPHAYLFWGQDMVGKRTIARACAMLAERNEFVPHQHILNDCLEILPDETHTIGINAIRALRRFASQKPNVSPYRMVIIDDGHLLTDEAQNALLKIAEDPPSSLRLILIVRDPEILRATVVSRFQKLYFGNTTQTAIAEWLQKKADCTKETALRTARRAYGAPGRAYALVKNHAFQETESHARKFLAFSGEKRRAFLKNLVAEDAFALEPFLDAVIVVLHEKPSENLSLLHRTLTLRRQAAFYNLNPRLQLEAL